MINYYTDYHDVDENLMTIASQGCGWMTVEHGGIHDRNLMNPEVFTSDNVASRLIYLS